MRQPTAAAPAAASEPASQLARAGSGKACCAAKQAVQEGKAGSRQAGRAIWRESLLLLFLLQLAWGPNKAGLHLAAIGSSGQVRMAEWSKALRSGRSPLLRAWVRIPLLTAETLLFFFLECCVPNCRGQFLYFCPLVGRRGYFCKGHFLAPVSGRVA